MKEAILSIARHLMTIGAGALATKGIVDASMVEPAVAAVLTLLTIGLKVYETRSKA